MGLLPTDPVRFVTGELRGWVNTSDSVLVGGRCQNNMAVTVRMQDCNNMSRFTYFTRQLC